MAYGTPPTLTAGVDFYTAALWNTYVRDNLAALTSWSSYTPTITQDASHATSIAKTVNRAKYVAAGKLITYQVRCTMTAGGTAGQAVTVSLPVTAAASGDDVGTGAFYDASGPTTYPVYIQLLTTSQVVLYRSDQSFTAFVGGDPNVALASSDVVRFTIQYEAA